MSEDLGRSMSGRLLLILHTSGLNANKVLRKGLVVAGVRLVPLSFRSEASASRCLWPVSRNGIRALRCTRDTTFTSVANMGIA